MNVAYTLTDATCSGCDEEELVYWTEDETETTDEVYVDCRGCGKEYPKRFVKKTDDTPREEIARDIAGN
ncbi:hypothetical protein [Natronosalvus rutilus]|uniref:Uncharacterized protein n=1 Tax=Natronosalvus rutilus TaxID=2953753 RepID=A0A9E7SZL8_9EURY|nr:hypothetical protein [Natronosalvus rutilus]UTF56023.1 hypothetical protein NGM29_20770 [Natronosalvus rutilus]